MMAAKGRYSSKDNLFQNRVAGLFFLVISSYLFFLTSSVRAQALSIIVSPDTIDFGRVRVGNVRDSSFHIKSTAQNTLQVLMLVHLDHDYLSGTPFTAEITDTNKSVKLAPPSQFDTGTIIFAPQNTGLAIGHDTIAWTTPATDSTYYIPLVLIGIGIGPNVISEGYNFRDVRVDDSSTFDTITIANNGTDTSAIDDVSILYANSPNSFLVLLDSLDSLPVGHSTPLSIGYTHGDSSFSFLAQFQPRSIGFDTLIVRIHTVDNISIKDTLTGRGVEPHVVLLPTTIDFGTITVQPNSPLNQTRDSSFQISNMGTLSGVLDTLIPTDDTDFSIVMNNSESFNKTLSVDSTLTANVAFHITQEGDFFDTVYLPNDTRYQLYPPYRADTPFVILKAKVRSGPLPSDSLWMGTFTNCIPDTETLDLVNPYPIEVHIDTIVFLSDTAGFDYVRTFKFGINIPPEASYPLRITYAFPEDSGNGPQNVKMALFQNQPDSEPPHIDTITASVIRKAEILTLKPIMPHFASSAADIQEMQLPILIDGPRNGTTDLDNWTFSLTFSNDLFVPTNADTAGSLSVPGDTGVYSFVTYWDQASRTYTIAASGTAVSDSLRFLKNLLLTLHLQAYVTTDTSVQVTPEFSWTHHPCAYGLQTFTLSIPYADDCGDPTLRAVMENENPLLVIMSTGPDPVSSEENAGINYHAAEDCTIKCLICDANGNLKGVQESSVLAGNGTITIPSRLLPRSGLAFIRLEAVSADGSKTTNQTCKILVIP